MHPELRHDPVSGRSVIIAPARAARPHTAQATGDTPMPAGDAARCPFCPGHEHDTPPEVFRVGDGAPDGPGWRVRVTPNLYPFVTTDAGPGAIGVHEVVIVTPVHDRTFARMDDAEVIEAVTVLRDRVRAHTRAGHAYSQALVNHGRAAGASIAHPHAQVVSIDRVPPGVEADLARAAAANRDPVEADLATAAAGLVVQSGDAPLWCPHASSAAYQMRLTHRSGGPRFDEAPDDQLALTALVLRDALARLDAAAGDPPYNVTVHSAPPGREAPGFRWRIEISPRLLTTAGFELASGLFVNTVLPETAAEELREVAP